MKSYLVAIAILTVAITSLALDDPERWAPGMILIEIEDNGSGAPDFSPNGFITTGWPEIDLACEELRINGWRQMIPIAPNPKYRDRWRWTERWFVLTFDPDVTTVPTAVNRMSGLPGVKYIEPNYRGKLTMTPNDPYYAGHQWYVRKTNAHRVWDFTTGRPEIIMSAVDSGVDYLHPDLTNRIWQNLGEDANGNGYTFIPGVGFDPGDIDSIDNDGNGYIDDFIGWDWVDGAWMDAYRHPAHPDSIHEDGYMPDNDPSDFVYNGHGTHCTGTMTAEGNNGIGIAGMTWDTRIMCARAGYYSRTCNGYNQNDAVVQALPYGLNKGCKVFNFSYGGDDSSHFVHVMIDSAVNSWGAVITAAAGNDDHDLIHYPSAYPEVINVAATDQNDYKTYFSNFHPTVDISAPGIDIGATVPRHYSRPPSPCDMGFTNPFAPGYADFQGTSMAAPVVAGAAGLLLSFHPDSSNEWVRRRLLENTIYIYDRNPSYAPGELLGSGRVDVYRALGAGIFPVITLDSVVAIDAGGDGRFDPGENVDLYIHFSNTDDPIWAEARNCTLHLAASDSLVEIIQDEAYVGNIAIGANASNSVPVRFRMRSSATYGHYVQFVATLHGAENYSYVAEFVLMVGYPEIVVASQDTNATIIGKVTEALEMGQYIYDVVKIPLEGFSLERMRKHRAIVYVGGKDETIPQMTTALENNLQTWLTEPADGRMLFISGQNLPEQCSAVWLANNFGAVHAVDSLGINFGMNVTGFAGDTLSDGYSAMNIVFGGGGAGNRKFGSCRTTGGGIPIFYYNYPGATDSLCGVRYEDPSGWRTVMLEFGIEAMPDSLRYLFIHRIMNWGAVWQGIEEYDPSRTPARLEILPAFPNPFNDAVTICFALPEESSAKVEVFDISGRLVREFNFEAAAEGTNFLRWDAKTESGERLPTGTYLYRVESNGLSASGKIIYIK